MRKAVDLDERTWKEPDTGTDDGGDSLIDDELFDDDARFEAVEETVVAEDED